MVNISCLYTNTVVLRNQLGYCIFCESYWGNVHCFVRKLQILWDFIQTIPVLKFMTRNNCWNYVFVIAAGRVRSAPLAKIVLRSFLADKKLIILINTFSDPSWVPATFWSVAWLTPFDWKEMLDPIKKIHINFCQGRSIISLAFVRLLSLSVLIQ